MGKAHEALIPVTAESIDHVALGAAIAVARPNQLF